MSLKSNALLTIDEFISSIGLSKLDIKMATFGIYNASTDCTDATIVKSGNNLTLTVTGGVNAHSTTFDLTNVLYNTITLLTSAILTLNKGWVVNVACSGSFNSYDIYNMPSKSVKGENLELVMMGFNSLMLEDYINISSQFAETYCNRKFISQAFTEYLDGTGEHYLKLSNFPVNTSGISVKQFDNQSQTELVTMVEHQDWELYADEGMIFTYGQWTEGVKNYKVTYTAGYSFANLPSDLKNACLELAKFLYVTKEKQGMVSVTDGIGTTNYDRQREFVAGVQIPAHIIAMLVPYARKDTV